jgi:hypothetical protein
MHVTFEILDIRELKPHEQLQAPLLAKVMGAIEHDGQINIPILVEREHHVILDGHHRFEALRRLGCRKAPAYVVDYYSEEIGLTTWPGAIVDHVSKDEVIAHGLRGELFPPKTTRHLLREKLPESPVRLKELM